MRKIELTRHPAAKKIFRSRFPQLVLIIFMLAGFVFAILSGFIGTPVGNHNFSIVFIWIAWWAILIMVAVPFFGRGWCAVCPIPVVGDWIQRGSVLNPASRLPKFLKLRVPGKLRNMWSQNLTFLLVALFSSIILTTPSVTAIVLAIMFFLAIGLSMIFERRAFCRYLCPVGGFIGLYAQSAPLELRIKDKTVCVRCEGKPCYNGSVLGSGCPWDVFPGGLTRNTYCGLCMECIRTCPHENISINLRPFSDELAKPSARMDEAFKALIMMGAALIYAYIFMGSNGAVKLAAYNVFSAGWFIYAAAFLAIILLLLPGIFWLMVKAGNVQLPMSRKRYATASTALIPLGLMFWVAFSLSFVLSNFTYILATLSDPLGLGWNLFGTAAIEWQPVLSGWISPVQILVLVAGLIWSIRISQKTTPQVKTSPIPVMLFCLMASVLMIGLLL